MDNLIIIASLKNVFEQDYKVTSFDSNEITERIYCLNATLYSKYEVSPRQFFGNAALNTLTHILNSFSTKKFKEKVHPEITETERQENMNNAEKLADQIIKMIQSN